MREKKEPLEIECADCKARFRLWIPLKKGSEWERGARISCIRCGAAYFVRKTGNGFHVEAQAAGASTPEQGFAIERGEEPVPLVEEEEGEGRPAGEMAPAVEAVSTESGEGPATVLVVEDDALSRKMVENSLGENGGRLILVNNGEAALETLRSTKVDLLVVDLYLRNPDDPLSAMDGEQVLEEAAKMGKIPAIVVTGKELVDDISLDPKWFDLHVRDFIQKGNPFWVDELKVKVRDIIAKS